MCLNVCSGRSMGNGGEESKTGSRESSWQVIAIIQTKDNVAWAVELTVDKES